MVSSPASAHSDYRPALAFTSSSASLLGFETSIYLAMPSAARRFWLKVFNLVVLTGLVGMALGLGAFVWLSMEGHAWVKGFAAASFTVSLMGFWALHLLEQRLAGFPLERAASELTQWRPSPLRLVGFAVVAALTAQPLLMVASKERIDAGLKVRALERVEAMVWRQAEELQAAHDELTTRLKAASDATDLAELASLRQMLRLVELKMSGLGKTAEGEPDLNLQMQSLHLLGDRVSILWEEYSSSAWGTAALMLLMLLGMLARDFFFLAPLREYEAVRQSILRGALRDQYKWHQSDINQAISESGQKEWLPRFDHWPDAGEFYVAGQVRIAPGMQTEGVPRLTASSGAGFLTWLGQQVERRRQP